MSEEQFKFKHVALSVLTDITAEVMRKGAATGNPMVSEDDTHRLVRVTDAALTLGATQDEVAAALKEGWARKP